MTTPSPAQHSAVKHDLLLFIILITVILAVLFSLYFYDLRQPFFNTLAKQFYSFLVK